MTSETISVDTLKSGKIIHNPELWGEGISIGACGSRRNQFII